VSFVSDNPTDPKKPPQRLRARRNDPLGPDGEIGGRLRALYAQVEQEPIPADLVDLLERLDEAERRNRP
jgi:hypothetical protein